MMTSLDNLQRYKTEGEAMLERIVTGDETMGSSLSTGDKAGFKAMETQRISDSDQVQDCALSEQSDGYCVLGHKRSIAC